MNVFALLPGRNGVVNSLLIAVALLGGCTNSPTSEGQPDPSGTITTDLRILGTGNCCLDFETGSIANVGACPTLTGALDMGLVDGNFCTFDRIGGAFTMIASVGQVSGIGAITPTGSGFVRSLAATIGHGYLIQTGEQTRAPDGTLVGGLYAVYVVRDIISSSSGGIIGKQIKWRAIG